MKHRTACEDCRHKLFALVSAYVICKNPNTPNRSSIAGNAITKRNIEYTEKWTFQIMQRCKCLNYKTTLTQNNGSFYFCTFYLSHIVKLYVVQSFLFPFITLLEEAYAFSPYNYLLWCCHGTIFASTCIPAPASKFGEGERKIKGKKVNIVRKVHKNLSFLCQQIWLILTHLRLWGGGKLLGEYENMLGKKIPLGVVTAVLYTISWMLVILKQYHFLIWISWHLFPSFNAL